ncbi:Smr/MutS family protein [Mesorhizobium marinum]|uniref:Smr/MutS family protein n=1 Tax=Mesorhizobium marinum TaxID=3228790 RepID=A0ABV3QYK8_9HYPH
MSRKTDRPGSALSDEDRVLWNLVARSTRPLKGRSAPAPEPAASAVQDKVAPATESRPPAAAAAPTLAKSLHLRHALDRPTLDKLSRGKLPIEGRVDLHGMTQSEAHALLLSFLKRAHDRGVRYVLVITGKGFSSGGDGILKRQVPAWLATPPFRALVSSHDVSARHHGGEGALYLRIRRKS